MINAEEIKSESKIIDQNELKEKQSNDEKSEKSQNNENLINEKEKIKEKEEEKIEKINEKEIEKKEKEEKSQNDEEIQINNKENKNEIKTNEKEEIINNSNNESNKEILSKDNIIENKKEDNNNIKKGSFIKFIEDKNPEISKIKGEEEIETSSNNNLYYLGNLFRDVVNKYDMENEKNEEPRQLIEKTKIFTEKPIIEDQSFNFSELINVQLNEVKQSTLSYLDKAKNELDKRYSIYINKINEYINENELKISKVFPRFETNENFMNYADDKIFKQIDYLLEIHENIFSALEDHISLLFSFLDQISLIQQKNPFEHFLNTNSNDILNCWFLSKINFDKLSLSNVIMNKNLSDLVSGYLCKKRENNFAKITIQKDTKGNLSLETEFLRDNINNLKKLKFLGLSSDTVNQILSQLNKKSKEKIDLFAEDNQIDQEKIQIGKKLKSLSIIESNISPSNELPKINLPVLRKVKIKKSRLPLNYFFDSIVDQTSFLRIINMQNCKITDKDFIEFFSYLNHKSYLQESIQYLGFSGNDLSYINLKKFVNKGGLLKNLQYFDLSKNNIYEFVTDNFKALPQLKVLDLSDNNISNYVFFDSIYTRHKKGKMPCFVLLSNNIFVSNNKLNNREYRKYIYQCLTNFKYKIKKLNLCLLYNKDNNEDLTVLRISPSVKISMIKLNLSFCGLKTETIWKFFQNNYGLLNLVSLNLSYNFISNNFFYLCAGQDILLEKLRVIDLSMNQISCREIKDLNQIETFINNYQKLKKIKIQENSFMKDLFLLFQKSKNEVSEIIDRFLKKEIKFVIDMANFPIVSDRLNDIIILKDKNI